MMREQLRSEAIFPVSRGDFSSNENRPLNHSTHGICGRYSIHELRERKKENNEYLVKVHSPPRPQFCRLARLYI